MKKYKSWVGLITLVLCALILNSSSKEVVADSKCTQKVAQDYYQVSAKMDDARKVAVFTAKKGVFTVTLTGTVNGTYTLTAGTPLEVPYDGTKDAYIEGVALLAQGDEVCDVDDKNKVKFEIILDSGNPNDLEANEYYNNLCKTFRDETAAKGSAAIAFMQNTLAYCYQPEVEANYSKQNVEAMIKNANSAWQLKQLTANAPTGDLSITAGFEKVNSTDLKSTLKCDPWSKQKNTEKYAYTETVISNNVCRTECKEELTIIYDPPVSVKAGLCFTYTVEVKSKVTCNAIVTGNPPTMPKVCNPYPVCNGIVGYTDQAGPNEDFDKCIQKCDNGKYSQKCINKCYKKVYGSSGIAGMLSYEPDARVEKMASGAKCNASANYQDVYNDIQSNGTGNYYWSGNSIKWNAGSCHWEKYGRYYFKSLDKAGRTVVNEQGGAWGIYRPHGYHADGSGFKRSSTCRNVCSWTGCSAGSYLNADDAAKEYQQALAEYERKVKECTSAAKCEEKTSTFTMSVLPSNGGDWIKYEATNRPQQGNTGAPAGDSIVNDHSGLCYGKTDAEGNDYRTVINFPGVWRNNKNGQVVTIRPPKNEEVFYEHKPNQFCTPLDSMNVNEKWWVWDQGVKEYTDAEKTTIANDLKYNIKARVKNFGRFGWNLNINCFYAIYNGTFDDDDPNACKDGNCPINPTCDLGGKNCVTTDITNYRYKAAALDDLFVGEKETTNVQETGRDTGWNWSCAATDLTDKDYPVAPTALITDIQSKGDDIYKDDSKYLDYSITLTPSTISKIKITNKTQKNFLNYTGNRNKKNSSLSRSVYRSSLLDELGSGVVTTRYTSAIGCNNQEGGSCVTSNMIPKDQCMTTYESLMK